MKVLVVATWFPRPLSTGAKIRAHHLVHALAQRHEVALASFADMPLEPAWIEAVRRECRRVEIVDRGPFEADRLRGVLGFLSPRPRSLVATESPEMHAVVGTLAREWRPTHVLALTMQVTPYLRALACVPRPRTIVDLDNFPTHTLHDELRRARRPLQRLRRWAAWRKARRYDRSVIQASDVALFTSRDDLAIAAALGGGHGARLELVPNGVDTAHHHPGLAEPERHRLVFNGAVSYAPNRDAMEFFLAEILPRVRARMPSALVTITGERHPAFLDGREPPAGVELTGHLDDVRPVVARSWACVVPLRMGGGTRVKILEAMALGTPVVTTTKGAEGLDVRPGTHLLIADSAEDFAAQTLRLVESPALRTTLAANARRLVEDRYDWRAIGAHLCDVIEGA